MTTETEALSPAQVAAQGEFRGRSHLDGLKTFITHQPTGAIGLFIFVALAFCAAFAPIIATHDPIRNDVANQFRAPSSTYFFGTDQFGRDMFSRVIWGSRTSLFVGLSTVSLGTTLGAVIGISSAYYSRFDIVVQRLIDTMQAVPSLIFSLLIIAVLGPSFFNTILIIAIIFVPGTARVMRSSALGVMQQPFVEAARSVGASDLRIVFRHIAPNCFAPFIILASNGLALAIILEASLSYLGLGTPPPRPSWGGMLSGSVQGYITIAPWLAIFPGAAITIVALGFSLFGDALRDTFDPRLRGIR